MSTYTCIKCKTEVTGLTEQPDGSYMSPCQSTEGNHVWIKTTNTVHRLLKRK